MSRKSKPQSPSALDTLEAFKSHLTQAKRVLLSTHLLPDGDGLGAEAALFHYLKRSRKSCRIYNPDPLPPRYRFLDPEGLFLHGPGEAEIWDQSDLWIIVDTNDPTRVGKLWTELGNRTRKIFFLDHHQPIPEARQISYPPHCHVVADPDSSSIGELLFHLFTDLNLAKMNKDVALGLYVSVMTDTNSFRYARTSPAAHRIAAEMITLGINPEEVYQSIYSSKEVSHLQLLGSLLQNVKVGAKGKIAWMEMDLETRLKYRASADDTQSFLNLLLLIRDAEVICLFREESDQKIRVSIKSKGRIVINQVASDLGGGGHEFAAGLAYSASLEQTVQVVIPKLEALLKKQTERTLV